MNESCIDMHDVNFENHFTDVSSYSDDSYLHSFLYYTITGRKSSWMYKGYDSFVIVCQHPHNPQMLLVFPEVGKKSYELTVNVLQKLYRSDHKIRLARYTEDDYKTLRSRLAATEFNIVGDLRVVQEDEMDWKYPMHVYDVGAVAELSGNKFEKLRTKFNKAQKQDISFRMMDRKTAVKDMRATLKYWEGSMIAEGKDTEDMSEFYERFFGILDTYNGQYDGMLFFQGRRPVGFTVWDQVNDVMANSFINLADISVTGLSDFQTVILCRYLREKGVKYLNVGGSETESLDNFKRKYHPAKSISLMSIDVSFKDFGQSDMLVSKFV